MLLEYNFSFSESVELTDISITVLEIIRRMNINKLIDLKNYDTRAYDPVMMLTLIVVAFSEHGYASLRHLEKLCKYDMRYRIIAQGQTPSYKAFQRFIKEKLTGNIEEITKEVYLCVQDEKALDEQIVSIDGTKFEANANKMTFFWRAWLKNYKPRHWQKCIEIIRQINKYYKSVGLETQYSIVKEPDIAYLIEIDERLEAYIEKKGFTRRRRGKHELAKLCDELKKSAVKMWEYTMSEDILGKRNSYSKTDPDATFMHMKYDYYNHTNVFKPGYNVQVGVNNGYIAMMYISADANDVKTLEPFCEKYNQLYNRYPDKMIGDAGYGSYSNYVYCELRGIEAVLKYSGYEKKKGKLNDKNCYHLSHMERNEEGVPRCAQGHLFEVERIGVNYKETLPKTTIYYRNSNCHECPVRNKCTKAKEGRSARVVPYLEKKHKQIDEYLETPSGKRDMSMRSSQAEGAFGDIKKNYEYDRLKRKGESGVKVELNLVAIGYNIRHYHNEKVRKMKTEQKVN